MTEYNALNREYKAIHQWTYIAHEFDDSIVYRCEKNYDHLFRSKISLVECAICGADIGLAPRRVADEYIKQQQNEGSKNDDS